MKKVLILSLIIVGLFSFSINLEANCTGTSDDNPAALYGSDEVSFGYQQALENCCAGSIIYWFDFVNNSGGVWLIGTNGPNSSCAQQ